MLKSMASSKRLSDEEFNSGIDLVVAAVAVALGGIAERLLRTPSKQESDLELLGLSHIELFGLLLAAAVFLLLALIVWQRMLTTYRGIAEMTRRQIFVFNMVGAMVLQTVLFIVLSV